VSLPRERWLWPMLPLFVVALYLNFLGTPDAKQLLSSERIFYFHMGSASAAGIAFLVAFIASIAYLRTRRRRWDAIAAASTEIGVILTTMVLVSGILWGKVAWGVWWTWDPRLTATVVMWVMFVAYLLLREWTDDPERRASYAAVLDIVAFFIVPLNYVGVRWLNTIHPFVITTSGIALPPSMQVAMFVSMAAFMYLYVAWMVVRVRLLEVESGLDALKDRLRTKLDTF
jgi:heme exporter protein C